jgi:hypothetical protein
MQCQVTESFGSALPSRVGSGIPSAQTGLRGDRKCPCTPRVWAGRGENPASISCGHHGTCASLDFARSVVARRSNRSHAGAAGNFPRRIRGEGRCFGGRPRGALVAPAWSSRPGRMDGPSIGAMHDFGPRNQKIAVTQLVPAHRMSFRAYLPCAFRGEKSLCLVTRGPNGSDWAAPQTRS